MVCGIRDSALRVRLKSIQRINHYHLLQLKLLVKKKTNMSTESQLFKTVRWCTGPSFLANLMS